MTDLFSTALPASVPLAPGACWLPGFALPVMEVLWPGVQQQLCRLPSQPMTTPMGHPMSVLTTSLGAWGWVGGQQGYGYSAMDPLTGEHWPPMPDAMLALAAEAARVGGYADFVPDSCLLNVYAPGSKMGLHQDKDERDFSQPIVSVSLGIPATFLFGGRQRTDQVTRIPLNHGDVVVWGGASRRYYHGVAVVRPAQHPLTGACRINLTLRKAR